MFGRRLKEFIEGFAGGRAPFYLGHNPVAKIYLSVLLLVLVVQGVTGLVLAGTDVYLPPFGGTIREWVAADTNDPSLVRPYAPDTVDAAAYARMREFRAPIVATHGYGYFVLLAMIAIHIGTAVVMEFKEGGSLISAMITGRKIQRGEPVDRET